MNVLTNLPTSSETPGADNVADVVDTKTQIGDSIGMGLIKSGKTYNLSGNEIDAQGHFWQDHNGNRISDCDDYLESIGVLRKSSENGSSVVGRGVLLDIAGWKGVAHLSLGEALTADDLDQCAHAQNVKVQSGDIILLRTGWMSQIHQDKTLFNSGEPGLDESTIAWLKDHCIVAVGADNHSVEVMQNKSPKDLPLHRFAFGDSRLVLMENINLEQLAADKVYESLVIISPLSTNHGKAVPINPIAIS